MKEEAREDEFRDCRYLRGALKAEYRGMSAVASGLVSDQQGSEPR